MQHVSCEKHVCIQMAVMYIGFSGFVACLSGNGIFSIYHQAIIFLFTNHNLRSSSRAGINILVHYF